MVHILFLDSESIESNFGLRPTFHSVTKHANNPIFVADRPWEGALMPFTVTFDDEAKLFRMWYGTFAGVSGALGSWVTCYATSVDGLHWERPNLHLLEFGGGTANNLCAIDTGLFNVIKDQREADPARRYKALYWGTGPVAREGHHNSWMDATSGYWGICASFSPDGMRWTPHPENPLLTGTGDTESTFGWDERYGKYIAYIRPGRFYKPEDRPGVPRRVIGRAESDDFVNWTDPVTVLVPDADDPPQAELYHMHVQPYGEQYISLLHVFVPGPDPFGPFWTELASSRDGIRWRRLGRHQPFIALGEPGSWDGGMIWAAKGLVNVGDELWIYYSGWKEDHGTGRRHRRMETDRQAQQRAAAVGLARIRRDGFVSLDADDTEGQLVSQLVVCSGETLRINASAPEGVIMAELLDETDRVISGFERAECDPFTGDQVEHPISWRGSASLERLRGAPIKVRLFIQRAAVFSITV